MQSFLFDLTIRGPRVLPRALRPELDLVRRRRRGTRDLLRRTGFRGAIRTRIAEYPVTALRQSTCRLRELRLSPVFLSRALRSLLPALSSPPGSPASARPAWLALRGTSLKKLRVGPASRFCSSAHVTSRAGDGAQILLPPHHALCPQPFGDMPNRCFILSISATRQEHVVTCR